MEWAKRRRGSWLKMGAVVLDEVWENLRGETLGIAEETMRRNNGAKAAGCVRATIVRKCVFVAGVVGDSVSGGCRLLSRLQSSRYSRNLKAYIIVALSVAPQGTRPIPLARAC